MNTLELEPEVASLEEVQIDNSFQTTETPKRGKGRPNVHPFGGRAYLLNEEVKLAMEDKQAFVELMQSTYTLTNERAKEVQDIVNITNELSFTIHGPILTVIEQLHKIRAFYGDKVTKLSISKERLVAPTNKLYRQPIMETIEGKDGKTMQKRIFEEFRSDTIYGYVRVEL